MLTFLHMNTSVKKSTLPADSRIFAQLNGIFYSDAYNFTERVNFTAVEIWLSQVVTIANWVNLLMAMRNNIVSRLGLKHLGHIGDVDKSQATSDYQIGDKIGIFTLTAISEQEIILIDSDTH